MLSTKRLLLGILVLGIVGMHGLITAGGAAAAHHGWSAEAAAVQEAALETVALGTPARSAAHTPTHSHSMDASTAPAQDTALGGTTNGALGGALDEAFDGTGHESSALALCLALLLAFGVVALVGRRTSWVAVVTTRAARTPLPPAPALRNSTPVARFTVMRC